MIVIDTAVLSAVMRVPADHPVMEWMDRQYSSTVWTTVVTCFEIRQGISFLPAGARRSNLERRVVQALAITFGNRVLPLNQQAAKIAGELSARRKRQGLNISISDTLIAGIAIANGAQIATRNEKHFADLDVHVINPWREAEGR
jgi:predicted nucleic acid-binding protein